MLIHKPCGELFTHYVIDAHAFSFMKCDKCNFYWGGKFVEDEVNRLMKIRVKPTIRRWS